LLEARAKLRAALELRDSAAGRALWRRLSRHPRLWRAVTPAIVYSVAFSADGQHVAAASQGRVVYVFERDTRAIRILRGHRDQVFAVAYAPDGTLASGSLDGEVRVWPRAGPSRLIGKHAAAVRALAFARAGKLLLSAGSDGKLRLFARGSGGGDSFVAGRVVGGEGGPLLALAVDAQAGVVAAAGAGQRVRLWRMSTLLSADSAPKPEAVLETSALVHALAFGREGPQRRLAVGLSDGRLLVYGRGGAAASAAGAAGAAAAASRWLRLRTLRGHHGSVRALAYDPRGAGTLASGGVGGQLLLWSSGGRARRAASCDAAVYGVAFDPSGDRIVAGGADRQVRLLDPRRVARERSLPPHQGAVNGVAFSIGRAAAQLASGGSDHTVRLWDARSGRQLRVLRGHEDRVSEVAYSPDGKLLASASWDRTVRLWDAASGAALRTLSAHSGAVRALVFHPTRALLATGARDGLLRLFRSDSGVLVRALRGHVGPIAEVAFSPDGKLVASAGHDRTVRLWRVPADKPPAASRRAGDGALAVLSGHSGRVFGLAFARDGKTIYSSSFDGSVRAWTLARGGRLVAASRTLLSGAGRLYRLALGPRGEALYVAAADGTARRIELGAGKLPRVRVVARHHGEVNDLVIDAAHGLATASDDGSLRRWRADGSARWRGVMMLAQPTLLLSHEGWRDLGRAAPTAPATGWARYAARTARLGAASGEHVCLVGNDQRVSLWRRREVRADQPLASLAVAHAVDDVLAASSGCLVLARGRLQLLSPAGGMREIARGVSAMASAPGRTLLVAGERSVSRLDERGGRVGARITVAGRVSALAAVGEEIVIGYADGSLERRAPSSVARRGGASFEGVPASAVTRLIAGPSQTIVAGFADGTVAMWRLAGGARLERALLHGEVRWLLRAGHDLFAVSALGDSLRWDLSAFDLDRCALLRELWKRVPVVWDAGQPRRRGVPRGHRCAEGAR
ncbi:MAG: hypothetical protein KC503_12825, partial [Myxococcales bacterium]|nr:hypothetical protein [Myxococcales bacterium]